MKPKLLVLTSTYPRWAGDTEPGFVHELSKRLCDDYEVHVLAPHAPGAKAQESIETVQVHRFRYAPDFLEQLAYQGGISERLRQRKWRIALVPLMLLCQWWATRRLIRQLRPAVIHAHWIFPQAFIALVASFGLREKPAVLCTVHGADWYRLQGPFWNWLKVWTLVRCDRVCPVSNVLRNAIWGRIPSLHQLSEAAPMGIDVPDIEKMGMHREAGRLLFVGRLVPKKGLPVLVEAMQLLQQSGLRFNLRIVGGGEDEAVYLKSVNDLGLGDSTRFLGAIPRELVTREMLQAAICVVPSLEAGSGDQEGLGLVLLEALASGCCVIASDIPVFRESLAQLGNCALWFEAGNSRDLAEKIALAFEEDMTASESCRQKLQETYSWSCSVDRYGRILDMVANN